ncbi:MAG TPA: hypothetical protein VK814_06830 [Acidobacteriaceae bacterium]|nr:hypothetical protein [Acidobacteriaceae bacterium]
MHPAKEGIFNPTDGWVSDTTIWGAVDAQAWGQLFLFNPAEPRDFPENHRRGASPVGLKEKLSKPLNSGARESRHSRESWVSNDVSEKTKHG